MITKTIEGFSLSSYVKIHKELGKEFGRVTIKSPEKLSKEDVSKVVKIAYAHLAHDHFHNLAFPPPSDGYKWLQAKEISFDIIATSDGKWNRRFPNPLPTCGGYPI